MNAETPTRIVTDSWRPQDAYEAGWMDHIAALEQTADGETALIAGRFSRRLEDILERVHLIEPLPHLDVPAVEVFDGEDG